MKVSIVNILKKGGDQNIEELGISKGRIFKRNHIPWGSTGYLSHQIRDTPIPNPIPEPEG
ncbi:Hypothetical protein FKW44_020790, partial [Caligus rogercresseyi]